MSRPAPHGTFKRAALLREHSDKPAFSTIFALTFKGLPGQRSHLILVS